MSINFCNRIACIESKFEIGMFSDGNFAQILNQHHNSLKMRNKSLLKLEKVKKVYLVKLIRFWDYFFFEWKWTIHHKTNIQISAVLSLSFFSFSPLNDFFFKLCNGLASIIIVSYEVEWFSSTEKAIVYNFLYFRKFYFLFILKGFEFARIIEIKEFKIDLNCLLGKKDIFLSSRKLSDLADDELKELWICNLFEVQLCVMNSWNSPSAGASVFLKLKI